MGEIDVDALSKQVPLMERTRYSLLKAVAAASHNDVSTFETLMQEIGANPLDKGTGDETPWEDLLHALLGRLRRIASVTVHNNYQAQGDVLLKALQPGWQQDPGLASILERAEVDIRLALNSEPPFDALGFATHSMVDRGGMDEAVALAIMEPTHMLGVGSPAGFGVELQVHRMCSLGFRLVVPEAFTVPTLADWQLCRRRSQLSLKDPTGALRARARIKPHKQWIAAADKHRKVLVLYGFGFDLDNPVHRNDAFASPQAFYNRFHFATARHLLAAGRVPWKP